jgi:hypothetical protein
MNEPAGTRSAGPHVRASDAERERAAAVVSDGAGEGRLSLAEGEDRIDGVPAGSYRRELDAFVAGLPATGAETGSAGRAVEVPHRLRVHAAADAVLSVLLVVRRVATEVPFFRPAGQLFLLGGSVLAHVGHLRRRVSSRSSVAVTTLGG